MKRDGKSTRAKQQTPKIVFETAKKQRIRKAVKRQFRDNVKRLAEKVDERARKANKDMER
ncbi:MAG: hypothetical protein VB018_03885 [Lachnospiraceae bacterium]|nr:hypothetical protein [Lachnospiraceae bacterium]